jgi:hypothetical protein
MPSTLVSSQFSTMIPIVPVSVCDMLSCLSLAVRSLSCSVRVRSRSSSVTSPLTFPIFYRALFHLPCHNRLHVHVHQSNSLLSNSFSTGLNFSFVSYICQLFTLHTLCGQRVKMSRLLSYKTEQTPKSTPAMCLVQNEFSTCSPRHFNSECDVSTPSNQIHMTIRSLFTFRLCIGHVQDVFML